ncbi:MAG: NUDIX hydrolase [Bdellovibrionota bacterium]
MAAPAPRPAATLVLLRPGEKGIETLLMRRHTGVSFMGGVTVFPGGRVDEKDASAVYEPVLSPTDWEMLASRVRCTIENARAHAVAVLRETFEEAGLLLASRPGAGDYLPIESAGEREKFGVWRKRISAKDNPATIADVAREEGISLRADRLVYFDHWITPEIEPKRYDTRFFVAEAPSAQEAEHDAGELVEKAWLTPKQAIEKYEAGEIKLAPPTLVTLWRLSEFGDVQKALTELGRRSVTTMTPKPKSVGGELHLILPSHPDYGPLDDPSQKADPNGPWGFTMRDGKWRPVG